MSTQQAQLAHWDELEQLYRDGLELLAGLDRLELYQAGAYVSMALSIMRQRHPDLLCEPDIRTSSQAPDP